MDPPRGCQAGFRCLQNRRCGRTWHQENWTNCTTPSQAGGTYRMTADFSRLASLARRMTKPWRCRYKNTSAREASRAETTRLMNRDRGATIYGQRLAVSSHPAARTGCGAGRDAEVGTAIRAVDCGPLTAGAKAGLARSESPSFSSESSGATSRNASTSFSSRVSSISFWRNTS